MAIIDKSEKKNKSIVFLSNTSDDQTQGNLETDEGISDVMVLLGRQFNNILKRMDRRRRPNVKNISSDIGKNSDSQIKTKANDQPNQGKGLQCYGCDGFANPINRKAIMFPGLMKMILKSMGGNRLKLV